MKKLIYVLTMLWLGMGLAFGQANITLGSPPFTGNPIATTGWPFTTTGSSRLFVAPNAVLQGTGAFSLSYWVQSPTSFLATTSFVDTRPSGTNNNGFVEMIYDGFFPFAPSLDFLTLFAPNGTGAACGPGDNCTRKALLTSGPWHHICSTWDGRVTKKMYIDSLLWDQSLGAITFVPSTTPWVLGNGPQSYSERDFRYYNTRALSPSDCATLYNMGINGLVPSTGPLATGMALYYPMNDCTPGVSCPDHSGNGLTATTDQSPPTCAILTPPAGATTGTVSLTASGSDPIGIAGVAWSLTDGVNTLNLSGSIGTAPYTFSLDTTTLVDGTYTLTATCLNRGGATATATESVTLGNSVTAKNYFFSPVGSDSNNCTTSGTPCATAAKFNSLTFHGGDTVAFDAGNGPLTTTVPFLLCSDGSFADSYNPPNNGLFPGFATCTQNVIPGVKTFTITNYNAGGTCNAIVGSAHCAPIQQSINVATPNNGITNMIQGNGIANVTIQNLFLTGDPTVLGNLPPNARALGSTAITVYNNGGSPPATQGNLIKNNYIIGFSAGVYVFNYSSNPSQGQILNNQITQTSPTSRGANPVLVNFSQANYNVVGNLLSNHGTIMNSENGFYAGVGVGIEVSNNLGAPSSSNPIVEFNVVHDNGYNNNTCGGSDAIETYQAQNVTIQNNEIYNEGTSTTSGCDTGGIDMDIGTFNNLSQYNYTHGNWGYGVTSYNGGGAEPGRTDIIRFNVSENDQRGNAAGFGPASGGKEYVYNNTIYLDRTGEYRAVAYIGIGVTAGNGVCPASGAIIANNIVSVSSNAVNGFSNVLDGGRSTCLGSIPNLFMNNLYFANTVNGVGGGILWHGVNGVANFSTLADWTAFSGETGAISANPLFVGTPPAGTCWPGGSTPPDGPQNAPSAGCPAAYVLQGGSPALNAAYTGLTGAPYNQTITQDYYGNACSGGNVHHMGASACQ